MKFNDGIWGAVLVVFAGVLFVHVQGFPAIPGQKVGPSALSQTLAIGLAVCGAIPFVRGLRAHAAGTVGGPWVVVPDWFASPPQRLAFVVLVAVNLLYLYGVDRLGFVLAGWIYLAALMAVLRVRAWRAVVVSLVMTLLIHYCFYKVLRVPLPWGLLQPIAW
jgi:putative tricarboxylic transport membrane protein